MLDKFNFFENLDEMVYVSDVDTYELIYVNRHLRQAMGMMTKEEYQGRRCHKVLQGFDKPCPFCNNHCLEPGQFQSWLHNNPVLNKRFLIKDTLVVMNGRRCRVEIAIDADAEVPNRASYYYTRQETILNECMGQVFSTTDPEESTERLLAYIGQTFHCHRVYIFELKGDVVDNTYEWCADGIDSQQEILQRVPVSGIDWWLRLFEDGEVTVIPHLEDIRDQYPESYAILKPQGITSLAAGPILADGEIVGFLGVDNPEPEMMELITPLLKVVGYVAVTLLKRRDLLARLHTLSYHDQLTGALNRNALAEYYGELDMDSLGVVYSDITGLKQVNDTQGHEAGDQMIVSCCEMLQKNMEGGLVYRTGGDEFLVLCPNCTEGRFQENVARLRQAVQENEYHMALGYAWSNQKPMHLEQLIIRADQVMYEDKRAYYQANGCRPGVDRRHGQDWLDNGKGTCRTPAVPQTPFQNFLATAYCDVEVMFQSMAQDNGYSYFYMGDMRKNLFYISDNMRDDFGFHSNLVPNLLNLWSRRISTPEFQDLYWQDISSMMRDKRSVHDLRYRVRDVHGNNQWIRCYGILRWNEDKTEPLFFSGRVTHQDMDFVVDPITNFPREHAAMQQLSDLEKTGDRTLVIGFGLNGLTEINSTKGRAYGDRLLKHFSNAMLESLCWKMSFYRLDGMRFMALVNPRCAGEGAEQLVQQIQHIVDECYRSLGISRQNTSSFAVLEYPMADFHADTLVENLISMIRVAKQDGSQQYVDYSSENIKRIHRMSNMTLALSRDVANHMENFRVVVQPVVKAETGRAIGGEVLLRWRFEDKDVSPASFIPILEKEKMIYEVGRWVFEQAVCACVRLRAHDPNFYLTFNVSLEQLSDPELLPFMERTLKKYRLPGNALVAELTESCLDRMPEKLLDFINACQQLGIQIALDDFGSGYSSLRMLLQYPSNIIKLDRSLVTEVTESTAKMNFIRSIVYACHQFGKTVCMEGVEHADENEIIRNTGCDMIQGYFYYRPMELSDTYGLISRETDGKGGA